MDWVTLIIDFSREVSKISNEWIVQLYFVSLRRETQTQKIVQLPHVNVVYKIWLLFLYVENS